MTGRPKLPPLDLFGHPIDPGRGKPGRPRHMPTDAQRARVAQVHGAGATQLEISAALGITMPTLRLNYSAELQSTSQVWRRRVIQKE